MVTRYGMEPRLGHATYERDRPTFLGTAQVADSQLLSAETTQTIDSAVREILDKAFDRATALLKSRREVLERGARELLEHETLEQKDLQRLVNEPSEAPAGGESAAG
jgi:cell division protease FtsH